MKMTSPVGRRKQRNNGHLPGCAGISSRTDSKLFGLQMRRVQAQVDLLGKAPRRVLQRHDFLRENLRLVVAGVDFADDEDGFARRQQFAILS